MLTVKLGLGSESKIILGYSINNQIRSIFPFKTKNVHLQKTSLLEITEQAILQKAILGGTGIEHSKKMVMAYHSVKDWNWGLLITQSKEELYSSLNMVLVAIVLISFLIFIICLFGFWLLLKPLSTRILLNTKELEKIIQEKTKLLEKEITKRQQTMEELLIQWDNLNSIYESMEDGIYIVNQQYDIEFANQSLIKEFGSFKGRKCYEYFHDQPEVCTWCNLNKVLDGKTVRGELFYKKNQRFYDLIDTPLKHIDGSVSKLQILRDITERRQAKETLKRNESQLRQIIDLVPHFIFAKDETGKFEIVNKATAEAFGTTVEDLTGRRDSEFVATEEEIEHFRADDLEVIHSGKTKFIPEEPMTDSDNIIRYLQTTKVPFKFSASKNPSLIGVAVDITQRVLLEKNLKKERQRLASILEGTNVGTWEWNVQTDDTIFNERWADIIGYTLEELSPVSIDTWIKFTHPDDLKMSGALLEKHFQGESNYYECEARMQHKNGEWIWVLDRGKVFSWAEDGKPLMMFGTHQDITERKQVEVLVQFERTRMLNVLNTIPNGIYIVSQQFNIEYINPAIEQEFGSIDNRKCYEYFHDRSEVCPWCKNVDVFAGKSVQWEWYSVKNNRHYDLFDTPFLNADGSISKFEMFYDITEHQQAKEQIKASLKEKETLLQEIHHRVKNNMTVISSLLKLQSNSIKDERVKEALLDSQTRIESMSMVHEALYQSENLSSIELDQYISKLTTSVFQNYTTSGQIELKIESEKIKVGAKQASPLGLIVNELISNSLKYAFPDDKKGEISMNLKLNKESEVELIVSDNGIGIPKGFDWQKADSLGLKLVKMLAENQLDGSIDMESRNGTKFTIKFNIES